MYIYAEAYIDEDALNQWCKENGYEPWDGSNLEVLTDYVGESWTQFDVVKVL